MTGPGAAPPAPAAGPAVEAVTDGSGAEGGFSPQDLQSAYRLPAGTAGAGQTVAVVDAYDDPNAQADLNVYRAAYNLPPCEAECFTKVNQEGGTTYPAADAGWALEISLDLDMVSAACPKCHIVLVEANSSNLTDLGVAENRAATLGATEISNSYSSREVLVGKTQVEADAKYYVHAGIPITAASGDDGYENAERAEFEGEHCTNCSASFPAGLSSVIAVGGTTLGPVGEAGRGWAEHVWLDSGSGCALYVTKPAWQTDKGCKNRTDNDLASVASGVSVYDSYAIAPAGWQGVSGTSASAPLTAAAIALESSATRGEGVEGIYKHPSSWFDVTEGGNYAGFGPECKEAYLCHGEPGYDGPAGIGTPNGAAATTPPGATTEAASAVTTTGATLNGVVDPEASATTYYFQYGRTALYGSNVPSTPAKVPGYTAPVEVAQGIASLKPQTEYHFRVISKSAAGTTYGPDRTFWTASKLYRSQFGAKGTTEGKFEGPQFTAVNAEGDVWVTDYTNDRVEEFSPSGAFIRSCGSKGTGNGQLIGPTGVAAQGVLLYVSDSGNGRIEAFTQSCEYWKTLGKGELSNPMGIAFPAEGGMSTKSLLLVANAGANDIAELDTSVEKPKVTSTYGVKGSGEGQFSGPTDIVLGGEEAPSTDLFYVVDSGNNRLQEFSEGGLKGEEPLTYKFVKAFGSKGSGEGQLSSPISAALDPSTGDLDVTDTGNKRVETFLPNGTYVAKFGAGGAGAEAFEHPAGMSVDTRGDLFIADSTSNRVDVWSYPLWRDEPTPNGPRELEEEPESVLYRVSCTSWNECESVGEYGSIANSDLPRPLAEVRKNGNEWVRQSAPIPAGAKAALLTSVSCTSASACTAVGEYESSGGVKTALAEGWNGTAWSLQTAAVPTGAKKSYLEGVSCTAAAACTAVGTYESSAGVQTALAESWNGTAWSLQTTAKLSSETKSSHLNDVVCTSTSSCLTVGNMVVKEAGLEVHHVLAERWSSGEWTSSLTAPEGSLWGVSCSSEKACMSVGNAEGKASGALAERWNGSEWSAQSMIQPEGGVGTLFGVSCGSATSCSAVGRIGASASFAESWNGTGWTLQSTEKPENTEHAGLFGVWCTAAPQCLTVGYAYAHVGTGFFPLTLGEVYP
jgi:hypothetical protein